ncbi:MAG TPA: hypothetical protein VHF06_19135 [Pseudonocardiaceae bacterium]|nr:hypothetical protein [Pseudonocardiaceae bacterium]
MGSSRSFPALGFDPAPGDVGAINDYVTALNSSSGKMSEARDAMSGLNVGDSWTGPAAEGFQNHVGKLGTNMTAVHGAMTGAGKVLDQWSTELGAMQSQADDLESQAMQAQQQLQSAQSNPDLNLAGQTFTDQASAQSAQQRYQSATGQVQAAQGQLDGIREQGRQLYQKHQQLAQGYAGALTGQVTGGGSTGLSSFDANAKGGVRLMGGKTGGSVDLGDGVTMSGTGEGSVLGADGSAGFHLGTDGFSANADGEAYIAKGSITDTVKGPYGTTLTGTGTGFLGVKGHASEWANADGVGSDVGGFAGADLDMKGSGTVAGVTGTSEMDGWAGAKLSEKNFVGTDAQGDTGFSLGGDAEAGAGIDVTDSVSAGGVGVSVGGGPSVGVGAGAGVHAYEDSSGTYHVGGTLAGDFIVGGGGSVDLQVNPQQVESTASTVGGDIEQGADTLGNDVASGAQTVGGYVESGAKTIAKGIEDYF